MAAQGAAPEQAGLEDWVEGLTGGRAGGWQRLVSGNSRTTWAVDVEVAGAKLELVIRADEGNGPYSDTPLTLAREATAYAALQGRGIRIPRFHGYSDELRALAMERVAGAPEWDDRVLAGMLEEAARLHRLDVGELELPGFATTARDEIELWAGIAATRIGPPSPFVEFAIDFLRQRFPGEPERLVFVHGDLGVGNALSRDGAITALLDWELSHLGDPHDDLAFLTVRTALHELELPGFGAAVRQSYAGAAGLRLDQSRLRYWQAVGVLRILLTCLASVANPVAGRDRLVHYLLIPPLDRLLIGALAEIDSVALPEPEQLGELPRLPGDALIKEMALELAALPDQIADPDRRQRARRLRYLFGQLAQTWPLAGEIARRETGETPAGEPGERIAQLAAAADRRLAMFPRAVPMGHSRLAGFDASQPAEEESK